MSLLAAKESGDWLLTSKPIQSLARGVIGVGNWMAVMQIRSAGLRGLLEKGDLLPDIEVNALLNPLDGSGMGVLAESRTGDFTSAAPDNLTVAEYNAEVKPLSPIQKRWPWLEDATARERGRHSFIQAREILTQPGKVLTLLERYAQLFSPEHSVDQAQPSHSITPDLQGIGVKTAGISTQTAQGRNVISFPIKKAALADRAQEAPTSSPEPFTALEARAAEKLCRWLQDGTAGTDSVLRLALRKIRRQNAVGESGQTSQIAKASIHSASLMAELSKNSREFTHTGPSVEIDPNHDGNRDVNSQKEGSNPQISGTKVEDRLKRTAYKGEGEGRPGAALRAAMASADGVARNEEAQIGQMVSSLERAVERLSSTEASLSHAAADSSIEIGGTHTDGQRQSTADKGASEGPLVATVRAAMAPVGGVARNGEAQIGQMINSLERVVESLINIEASLSEATATSRPEKDEPTVQWLEDEDLAGRLQKILKRQARRKGIDLS